MTKAEIVERVASRAGVTQRLAGEVIEALFVEVGAALAETGKVALSPFGTLEKTTRPARNGRNPKTGAFVPIPPRHVVSFRAGKHLRVALGDPTDPSEERAVG